jgi:GT2 family glycosyltransferase
MIRIFTLHWNAKLLLERLYNSLIPALEGLDYCWYIKDNGSSDGSKEFLESIKSEKIIPYYTGHNRHNFSEGMNILFDFAKPEDEDYILLLNNDVVFGDTTSIKKMISLFKDDVGIVGTKLLYPGTKKLAHSWIYFSKKYNYLPYHYKHGEEDNAETSKNREVEAITAAVLLTKAKYYKQNPLDKLFFWCFEDVDFNLAIKYNMNKKIMYCGETLIYHEESVSLQKNPVNKLMMPANVKRFKDKWWGKYKLYD